MLNSEQRRERDTGDGQQGKMFLVLWELSFKKAEAFGYFRPTKVPRRRQKEKPEMITEMELNSESWNPHISTNILICSITGV